MNKKSEKYMLGLLLFIYIDIYLKCEQQIIGIKHFFKKRMIVSDTRNNYHADFGWCVYGIFKGYNFFVSFGHAQDEKLSDSKKKLAQLSSESFFLPDTYCVTESESSFGE